MKPSNYNVVIDHGETIIAENTLKGSVLKITNEDCIEFRKIVDNQNVDHNSELRKQLIEHGFLVESHEEEIANVHSLYNEYCEKSDTLHIILMMTRNCNFDCTYCYEEHEEKILSPDVQKSLIKFIQNTVSNNSRYKIVYLNFFGGEPLLRYDSMVEMTKQAKKVVPPSIEIRGGVTTNGYLLNLDRFEKLVSLGIDFFQITVDGPEDVHDKNRCLKNKSGTWKRIMENLVNMRSSTQEFKVIIRTNHTPESLNNADSFYKYVSEKFQTDYRFVIYYECVKNLGGTRVDGVKRINNQLEAIEYVSQLTKKYNLFDNAMYSTFAERFALICYAAKRDSFLLDCDGTIKKCSVVIEEDRNKVGKMNSYGTICIDEEKEYKWSGYSPIKECELCPIFPYCYGKKCPSIYPQGNYCKNLIAFHELTLKAKYC